MIIDYQCKNEKCFKYNKNQTKSVSLKEIDDKVPQLCDECKQELKRVWSFSGGIKTSDGYKS